MNTEARVAALESKIAALEQKIEDKKFAIGARGPAGDITAAVSNAETAALKIVNDAKNSTFNESVERLNQSESKVEKRFSELDTEVGNIVLKILREYHVVDENYVPYTYGK